MTLPGIRSTTPLAPFWLKMVLQGVILEPSGGPKSVKNHTFGLRSAQSPSKNGFRKGFRKNMKIWWKINAKMDAFWWLGTTFGVIFFAYFTLSPFLKTIEKSMKKGTPKVMFFRQEMDLRGTRLDWFCNFRCFGAIRKSLIFRCYGGASKNLQN